MEWIPVKKKKKRTSFPAAADLCNVSPIRCWSSGSTCTPLQILFNNVVVKFLTWLCLSETVLPFLKERAYSYSKLILYSNLVSVQPYLIQIRFRNNCLVIWYPSTKRCIFVSQRLCSWFKSVGHFSVLWSNWIVTS